MRNSNQKRVLNYVALTGSICAVYGNRFQKPFIADTESIAVKRAGFLCLYIGGLQVKRYFSLIEKKLVRAISNTISNAVFRIILQI